MGNLFPPCYSAEHLQGHSRAHNTDDWNIIVDFYLFHVLHTFLILPAYWAETSSTNGGVHLTINHMERIRSPLRGTLHQWDYQWWHCVTRSSKTDCRGDTILVLHHPAPADLIVVNFTTPLQATIAEEHLCYCYSVLWYCEWVYESGHSHLLSATVISFTCADAQYFKSTTKLYKIGEDWNNTKRIY